MKLIYWVSHCQCKGDEWCHHPTIRGKTRIDVERKLLVRKGGLYTPPKIVTTPEFTGSFDMLMRCLEGAWWENK